MRSLRLGLAAAVVCAGVLGLAGCQEDNNKAANITALPTGSQPQQPKSQKEYMEAAKANPGARPPGAPAAK